MNSLFACLILFATGYALGCWQGYRKVQDDIEKIINRVIGKR